MKTRHLALVCSLALTPVVADVEDTRIYSCPDANGELFYQQGPCDAPQPNRKPAPKPVEATKSAAAKPPAAKKPTAAPKAAPAIQKQAPKAPRAVPASLPKRSKISQAIRPVIDPTTFTADPKWGSPEKTLKTYIAAIKAGDRKLARACLVSGALDEMGPRLDTMPDDALRSTVTYDGFVMEGDLGPYWSIRALRRGSRPAWIFFERTSDGTWRIAAI